MGQQQRKREPRVPASPDQGPKRTLTQRYIAAIAKCKDVKKTGYNKFDNYHYPEYMDVVEKVRQVVIEEGIGILVEFYGNTREKHMTSKGKEMLFTLCKARFTLFCDGPQGPEHRVCEYEGESFDVGDKSMPKSHTAAFKDWLLKQFLVPVDDGLGDPASQTPHVDGNAQRPAQNARQQQGQGAKPAQATQGRPPAPASNTGQTGKPQGQQQAQGQPKRQNPPTLEELETYLHAIVNDNKLSNTGKLFKIGEVRQNWKKYSNMDEETANKGLAQMDQAEAVLNDGEIQSDEAQGDPGQQ